MNVNTGTYSPMIAGGIVVPPSKEGITTPQDIAGGIVVPPSVNSNIDNPNIAGGIVVPPTSENGELQEDVVQLSR